MGVVQSTAESVFRSAVDLQTGGRPLTAQSGLENFIARPISGYEWDMFMKATSNKSAETGKYDIDKEGVDTVKLQAHPMSGQLYTNPKTHDVMFRPFTESVAPGGPFCQPLSHGGVNPCEHLQAPRPDKWVLQIASKMDDALAAGNATNADKYYNAMRKSYELQLYGWYKNYLLLRDSQTITGSLIPTADLGCSHRDADGNHTVSLVKSFIPGTESGAALCNAESAYARGDMSTFEKEYNYSKTAAIMDGVETGMSYVPGGGKVSSLLMESATATKYLGLGVGHTVASGALAKARGEIIDLVAKKGVMAAVGQDQTLEGGAKRQGATSAMDKLGLTFETDSGKYLENPSTSTSGWKTTGTDVLFKPPQSHTSDSHVTLTPIGSSDKPPVMWA